MQLEQLASALQAPQPADAVRLPFVFAVRFPLWPLLRKELAEFYIAMGFVGESSDDSAVCAQTLGVRVSAQLVSYVLISYADECVHY